MFLSFYQSVVSCIAAFFCILVSVPLCVCPFSSLSTMLHFLRVFCFPVSSFIWCHTILEFPLRSPSPASSVIICILLFPIFSLFRLSVGSHHVVVQCVMRVGVFHLAMLFIRVILVYCGSSVIAPVLKMVIFPYFSFSVALIFLINNIDGANVGFVFSVFFPYYVAFSCFAIVINLVNPSARFFFRLLLFSLWLVLFLFHLPGCLPVASFVWCPRFWNSTCCFLDIVVLICPELVIIFSRCLFFFKISSSIVSSFSCHRRLLQLGVCLYFLVFCWCRSWCVSVEWPPVSFLEFYSDPMRITGCWFSWLGFAALLLLHSLSAFWYCCLWDCTLVSYRFPRFHFPCYYVPIGLLFMWSNGVSIG